MIQSIPSAAGAAPGGAVGGASSLTTVGAIPYVVSSGVLGQDASLNWSSADKILTTGTTSTKAALGSVLTAFPGLWLGNVTPGASNYALLYDSGGGLNVNTVTGAQSISFALGGVTKAQLKATTGNLLIGTTTDDGSNKLQVAGGISASSTISGGFIRASNVAASPPYLSLSQTGIANFTLQSRASVGSLQFINDAGSVLAEFSQTGTSTFYNQGAAGSTLAVIQAGAAQSGNLQEWRNNAGTEIARVNAGGGMAAQEFFNLTGTFYQNGANVDVGSGGIYRFSSSASQGGTKDLGLARNADGVLEIDSGTAGQYRDLILRRSQHSGVAVSALPAAAAGNAGSIQYVTDANATTISSVVAGGGANKVLVWSDGANWKIMAN